MDGATPRNSGRFCPGGTEYGLRQDQGHTHSTKNEEEQRTLQPLIRGGKEWEKTGCGHARPDISACRWKIRGALLYNKKHDSGRRVGIITEFLGRNFGGGKE